MGDLPARVHASIGPSCAGEGHWRAGNRGKGLLKGILHGAPARLGLPAEKAATVVLDA
jgi:hypothetical protein